MRRYFDESGFLELETPIMVKYTPGGARNFLVPSRMSAGKFYALAESPQLFKQLYMVAGFEKYFQIVKCFRDEALRLDRQPEFTQIDVEMSFVNQDDVFRAMEGLIFRVWKEVLGVDLTTLYPSGRFPQLPFEESMGKYGNDKPDLRFGLPHAELTDVVVRARGRRRPLLEAHRRQVHERRVPPRPARRDREGAAHPGRAREQAVAHRGRQARGVRQGHGRQGPRAGEGRRRRATGCSRRSRRR